MGKGEVPCDKLVPTVRFQVVPSGSVLVLVLLGLLAFVGLASLLGFLALLGLGGGFLVRLIG